MTTSPRTTRHSYSFGLLQMLALGTLLLFGALIAVPLSHITHLLPPSIAGTLDSALWGIEILLYLGISWQLSRHGLVIFFGLLLGFFLRALIALLMAALLHLSLLTLFHSSGEFWLLHAVTVLTVAILLLFPLRDVLASGFGMLGSLSGGHAANQSQQFHFSTKSAQRSQYKIRSTLGQPEPAAAQTHLQPPEGFTAVYPRDEIFGMANVPASVIFDSVPEAEGILKPDGVVRIRLAYIVPQLSHATLWLTWNQVFGKGGNEGAFTGAGYAETEFRDRWISVPAKYYALQVPQEHYSATKVSPAWMKLAEVPQEHQFKLEG